MQRAEQRGTKKTKHFALARELLGFGKSRLLVDANARNRWGFVIRFVVS